MEVKCPSSTFPSSWGTISWGRLEIIRNNPGAGIWKRQYEIGGHSQMITICSLLRWRAMTPVLGVAWNYQNSGMYRWYSGTQVDTNQLIKGVKQDGGITVLLNSHIMFLFI